MLDGDWAPPDRPAGPTLSVKVISAAITLFVKLVGNFFLFRALPAGPGEEPDPQQLSEREAAAAINRTFGLGLPLPQQFWNYVVRTFHGNFGPLFVDELPVLSSSRRRPGRPCSWAPRRPWTTHAGGCEIFLVLANGLRPPRDGPPPAITQAIGRELDRSSTTPSR
jgi:binding-protein-dependent transport system inner membrane component